MVYYREEDPWVDQSAGAEGAGLGDEESLLEERKENLRFGGKDGKSSFGSNYGESSSK